MSESHVMADVEELMFSIEGFLIQHDVRPPAELQGDVNEVYPWVEFLTKLRELSEKFKFDLAVANNIDEYIATLHAYSECHDLLVQLLEFLRFMKLNGPDAVSAYDSVSFVTTDGLGEAPGDEAPQGD